MPVLQFQLWLIHMCAVVVAHLLWAVLGLHGLQISVEESSHGSVDEQILFLGLNNKNLLC